MLIFEICVGSQHQRRYPRSPVPLLTPLISGNPVQQARLGPAAPWRLMTGLTLGWAPILADLFGSRLLSRDCMGTG